VVNSILKQEIDVLLLFQALPNTSKYVINIDKDNKSGQ
jgi:hypothetical protein